MATKYGAGAYPGLKVNPIGPSEGYVSPLGISESLAQYHPESVKDLTAGLSEAGVGSGRLVWIPKGVTITLPNATYNQAIKGGVILGGPGEIRWSYYGPTKGYMIPMFTLRSGGAVSGPKLTGGGGYGHYGQGAGPCAIRASGAKNTLVENVDLSQFRGGGVWFGDGAASITKWNDDAQRNILRHVKITHIQQYGFGYGVGLQGGHQAFLIEASILGFNRHSTMSSGGVTTGYEVRYCIFEDSVYADSDTGPAHIQSHQIDAHGGGWLGQSYRCGKYLWVHHCDLSPNDNYGEKPNVCIRGLMADGGWAVIEDCWTKKASHKGAFSQTENEGNAGLVLLAEEEGAAWRGPKALSSAGVICRNNWYGLAPPPDSDGGGSGTGEEDPPEDPPIEVNTADIKVAGLTAGQVAVGEAYEVKATVENKGDGVGSAIIEIGWLTSSGAKRPLKTEVVTLEAGESKTVVQSAVAIASGYWKFYCGDARATLVVTEPVLGELTVSVEVVTL